VSVKEDPEDEASQVAHGPTAAGTPLRVDWAGSDTRSNPVDEFQVLVGRDEIVLLLGKQDSDAAGDRIEVQLSDRVVLSPFAAKRFAALLNKIMQEHESKYGDLQEASVLSTVKDQAASPDSKPPFSEKAGLLFHLIRNLDVEYGFERSFKVLDRTLLGNRFLLTMSKHAIPGNPQERVLDICRRMDMPKLLLEDFCESLPSANYVHFGFEESEKAYIYKAYLEFWTNWQDEIRSRPDRSDPFLVYKGFKWDVSDNRKCALTRYTCYPSISVEGMRERLGGIFDGPRYGGPLEITKEILDIASNRITHDKILYLEVMEEDNPRRSFDINMYKANLRLEELHPLLSEMCRHYSVPAEEFRILYDQFRARLFGHLSGGIDREGRDFLTIYYGAEGH
jgi:hypothetical protein